MRRITFARYYLPPGPGRRKPYPSTWKMSPEEAAERGATEIVQGSEEVRDVPESDEEIRRAQTHYQSAGRDSVKPPQK
ncbi:hypothetical protein GCM10028796_16940 [Ramlibacter monticola]|uniref:Uncharacterized protein n=1 Tax=Ramlibacter monticola TaxID=1926872 RepID=A0A936YYL7_9BURK|nr:hypothetical protein [Ramlibacter monticola]MBL0390521.1 hypothetical protein [Ramlibacter monticola]